MQVLQPTLQRYLGPTMSESRRRNLAESELLAHGVRGMPVFSKLSYFKYASSYCPATVCVWHAADLPFGGGVITLPTPCYLCAHRSQQGDGPHISNELSPLAVLQPRPFLPFGNGAHLASGVTYRLLGTVAARASRSPRWAVVQVHPAKEGVGADFSSRRACASDGSVQETIHRHSAVCAQHAALR